MVHVTTFVQDSHFLYYIHSFEDKSFNSDINRNHAENGWFNFFKASYNGDFFGEGRGFGFPFRLKKLLMEIKINLSIVIKVIKIIIFIG